jgi:hypothetical protein
MAEIGGGAGSVTLSGVGAITSVDQLVPGPVDRIQLYLPDAGEPDGRSRLDSGIVAGAGVVFLSSSTMDSAPPRPVLPAQIASAASWTRPTPPRGIASPVFAVPVTAPPPPVALPVTMPPPADLAPPLAFPDVQPDHDVRPDQDVRPDEGARPELDAAEDGAPAPVSPAGWPLPQRTPDPAGGYQADDRSPDDNGPGDHWPGPSDAPPVPASPADDGPADEGAAGDADAASPAVDRSHVIGVFCPKGHFIDPRHPYCPVCGISLAQQTVVAREGVRPVLGSLLLDDGESVPLEIDYIIGRDPRNDPDAVAGLARPLKIVDAEGVVSRRHARIALVGWDVQIIDLGSSNGTFIQPPGAAERQQMAPHVPVVIRPGTVVTLGRRWLRFEPPRSA